MTDAERLLKEELIKANLKKLVLELENNNIQEPKGLASGKMVVELKEDHDE
ncbi:hypothetical protein I6F65_05220 [Pseudoalteromonas sp. SWXJZ94C]|uniref:hypothetical protein n=1 Tax=unclassified Pseudoalteromonas TaxID=194690 RepID=UPI00140E1A7B|nr:MULTISPECIES: hypothetical protein [unclassified Pseudoalteromonas]MBH0056353.1 hypothetical protein [Pseudoalteromonas sp. SWXJZ94C]